MTDTIYWFIHDVIVIMTICCVFGCSYSSDKGTIIDGKKVSFHKFPNKDKLPTIHRTWKVKINRAGFTFTPSNYSIVCYIHANIGNIQLDWLLQCMFLD